MRTWTLSIVALIATAGLASSATAQQRISPSDLPRALEADELDGIAEQLATSVAPVRTVQQLPRTYHPNELVGDGVAVYVAFDDGSTGLVTAWTHLAQATTVEVWVDAEWHDARVVHGGPIFDLAVLEIDAPLTSLTPIPIASDLPADPVLLSIAPVTEESRGEVVLAAFGSPPEDEFAYYVRSVLDLRNGYPVVDRDLELVAIHSFTGTDVRRNPGTFAIPARAIREWVDYWPQLDPDDPLGLTPRVSVERVAPTTGVDVLRP
ncbi:MAG: hypothetical protein KDA28_16635 [Phycisphaerales bacterium]|nr:hypothetical protein [Phycisphaerales bacterium]